MNPLPNRPRRAFAGFTLMELLAALAVVGVLAGIAIPTYTQQIQKTRRSDAKNALLDLAAREERYYATNNVYTATASALGYGTAFPVAVSTWGVTSYSLSVTVAASPPTFTALASRTGAQTSDACGDFQLTDQGTQSNLNTTNAPPTCW